MRTCQAIEYQFLVFGPLGNESFRTKPLNSRERERATPQELQKITLLTPKKIFINLATP